MEDHYRNVFSGVGDPGTGAAAIAPNDDVDLSEAPKGLYVGEGGDIAMIGLADPPGASGIIWRNVPSGALLPFRPRRVLATGTTAGDLIAIN